MDAKKRHGLKDLVGVAIKFQCQVEIDAPTNIDH